MHQQALHGTVDGTRCDLERDFAMGGAVHPNAFAHVRNTWLREHSGFDKDFQCRHGS